MNLLYFLFLLVVVCRVTLFFALQELRYVGQEERCLFEKRTTRRVVYRHPASNATQISAGFSAGILSAGPGGREPQPFARNPLRAEGSVLLQRKEAMYDNQLGIDDNTCFCHCRWVGAFTIRLSSLDSVRYLAGASS